MSASGINPSDHSRISGGIETGRRREPAVWTDLHGQQHVERVSEVPDHDGAVPRVIGDIEHSWELAGTKRRSELAAQMLSQPNPIVTDTATTPNPFLLACASEIAPAPNSSSFTSGKSNDGKFSTDSAMTKMCRDFNVTSEPMCDYTWVVQAPKASAVLLWANGLFDHQDPSPNEMAHLPGSDLWTLTWRLPASWRASYRISIWTPSELPHMPPWRASTERFAVRRAAMSGALDPRCEKRVGGANGEFSLAEGPLADSSALPPSTMPLTDGALMRTQPLHNPRVKELHYPATDRWLGQRVWLYCPCRSDRASSFSLLAGPTSASNTELTASLGSREGRNATLELMPLLVLFDGQTWLRDMKLPDFLDSAIGSGSLPPIHVAMIDSRDTETRWAHLGVPAGQAEFVATLLVADVQRNYPISRRSSDIVVSGQSLGGIASLWAAALANGRIGRVIAQSPSLWRFDMTEPLLARQTEAISIPSSGPAPTAVSQNSWSEIVLQAGHFEGSMLADSYSLAESLRSDSRLGDRDIRVQSVWGGHDWAWWRVNLVNTLSRMLSSHSL